MRIKVEGRHPPRPVAELRQLCLPDQRKVGAGAAAREITPAREIRFILLPWWCCSEDQLGGSWLPHSLTCPDAGYSSHPLPERHSGMFQYWIRKKYVKFEGGGGGIGAVGVTLSTATAW